MSSVIFFTVVLIKCLHANLFALCCTGPLVAFVSACWEAIPRANTGSARTIPVPNSSKPEFNNSSVMPEQNYVKVLFKKILVIFFSSWFRMKSKPWSISRTARPASNWTQSSLQLRCPKWPQTPRTIFTLPTPVTVCSQKTFPATALTWKRLPVPSSTPLIHLRVQKLQITWRSEQPRY